MMNLFILRHADSGWAEPGQRDIERCLSARGINQLDYIRDVIRDNGFAPQKVICSKAVRTKQTYSGIKNCLAKDTSVQYEASLYSGEVETYLDTIKSVDEAKSVMIIGHNPMCAGLGMQLSSDGEEDAMREMGLGYPSGALAHLQFKFDSWNKISLNSGYLAGFYIAR